MERIIASIPEARKNVLEIAFTDGSVAELDASLRTKYGLRVGASLSEEVWEHILSESTEIRVLRFLLHKIDCSARPEKEYENQLRQAFSDENAIAKAMEYAEKKGYFDDELFARNYYERYKNKRSVSAIKSELKRRGVSSESMQFLFEESDDYENVLKLALAFVGKHEKTPELKQKTLRKLASRGFSADLSYRIINEIFF